jgi:hypothetical protein
LAFYIAQHVKSVALTDKGLQIEKLQAQIADLQARSVVKGLSDVDLLSDATRSANAPGSGGSSSSVGPGGVKQ